MENKYITSDEWDEQHAACPVCGNTSLIVSLGGIIEYNDRDYFDDMNWAECANEPELDMIGCSWKGMVYELVPNKK